MFSIIELFCTIFPYHVLFDESMNIIQLGDGLKRICIHFTKCVKARITVKMADVFEMIHPMMSICYSNIEHFMNAVFLLQVKPQPGETSSQMVLKGQIVLEPITSKLFFIGSPRIESLADLKKHNIYLSDIPLYDVTRELVLLNQQRIAEIEVR
ncbi:Gucy1b2 [Bugula neritina]|uniref:guanylate cyclase n=1 Tax=Bugula neritina TaxID=10212 RepID=A0A7J7IYE4_BUGNE|nr:Gucy1b2 [Bugula neritina]